MRKEAAEVIRKLPFYPFSMNGDPIADMYVTELQAVDSEEKLGAFLKRWGSLYAISLCDNFTAVPFEGLHSEELLSMIQVARNMKVEPTEEMANNLHFVAAMEILMPCILLEFLEVSVHFGVPYNVAVVQALELTELF